MNNDQTRSAAPIVRILAAIPVLSTPTATGDEKYDAVVYGATPTESTPAIAATRAKASVIVIEPHVCQADHAGSGTLFVSRPGQRARDVGRP